MDDCRWPLETRGAQAGAYPSTPAAPACRGERARIDGPPHGGFEERGPRRTLIVFIDDATSELLALRFAPAETTRVYMETLRDYLARHGRPVALYSGKHSIFRVNRPEREGEPTRFTRARKTLDIGPIHANTPQARGRVEQANQTLQDRPPLESSTKRRHFRMGEKGTFWNWVDTPVTYPLIQCGRGIIIS